MEVEDFLCLQQEDDARPQEREQANAHSPSAPDEHPERMQVVEAVIVAEEAPPKIRCGGILEGDAEEAESIGKKQKKDHQIRAK